MSSETQVVKCPTCGRPYRVYMFTAADQSACQACVKEADESTRRPDTIEERFRRLRFFGGRR